MSSEKSNTSRGSAIGGILAIIITAAAALGVLMNRQQIMDQFAVWQYQPTAEITALAERAAMNETGEFYFYASSPALESAGSFNQDCGKKEPQSAVLGCYVSGRIYIYDVTDERLDGIREVTAAHEMLHAAYDRLPASEKERVNGLLEQAYSSLANDELKERMELYERTQPGSRTTELHSIFGTEYGNLPLELEEYYGRYFSDRAAVVALHAQYSSVFDSLSARADEINAELDRLSAQIDAAKKAYETEASTLSADVNDYKRRVEQPVPQEEYDRLTVLRDQLTTRLTTLEQRRRAIDEMVNSYNKLVEEQNQISSEVNSLRQSIDSSLEPAPEL